MASSFRCVPLIRGTPKTSWVDTEDSWFTANRLLVTPRCKKHAKPHPFLFWIWKSLYKLLAPLLIKVLETQTGLTHLSAKGMTPRSQQKPGRHINYSEMAPFRFCGSGGKRGRKWLVPTPHNMLCRPRCKHSTCGRWSSLIFGSWRLERKRGE